MIRDWRRNGLSKVDAIRRLVEVVKRKEEDKDAVEKGKLKEGDQREHQDGDALRSPAEAGHRDRDAKSRKG